MNKISYILLISFFIFSAFHQTIAYDDNINNSKKVIEKKEGNITKREIIYTQEKIIPYENKTIRNIVKYITNLNDNLIKQFSLFFSFNERIEINKDSNLSIFVKNHKRSVDFLRLLKDDNIRIKDIDSDIFFSNYTKELKSIIYKEEPHKILEKIKLPYKIGNLSKDKEVYLELDLEDKLVVFKDMKGKVLYNSFIYGLDLYKYYYPYNLHFTTNKDGEMILFVQVLEKGYYGNIIKNVLTFNIKTENVINEDIITEINKKNKKLTSLLTGEEIDSKYNIIEQGDILLEGKTYYKDNVTNVFINDYKLKSFIPRYKHFRYRLKEEYDNLKKGKNIYNIFFEIDGKKVLQDTIYVYNEDYNLGIKHIYEDITGKSIEDSIIKERSFGKIEFIKNHTIDNHCNFDYIYFEKGKVYCISKVDNSFLNLQID